MASEVEPAKLLLPYLQRADELQKHEPLVAYYCRVYAMERGLKIPVKERTKTTNALLVSLMNQLEKDKKSLTLGQEDNLYVEGFALNVFGKADKQDRAGRADLNTAKTFYAASIFFEILHQFGEIQPDIEQKQKYSVWKAADIRKAISEGRKPLPGPPGGDELSVGSEAALDPQISPEQKNFKVSQEKPPAGQPSDSGLRIPRAGMDAWQGSTQPLQPDDHYHDSDDIDLPSIPQQPLKSQDHSVSGYPSLYSGTYYTPSSRPDAPDVSSTLPSYQYGSLVNGSDGQPQHPGYHSYAPTSPDGQICSNVVPSAHLFHHAEHASSDTSYIQSPGAHVPSAPYAVNPTSTYTAPEYVSYFPGQSGIMGYGDSSLLPRTASAPAAPELSAVSSVKGTTSGFYQPPPEKIAEAHKASRFAVSALAFDDVPTAIAYLKQSLELLTNPSAPVH